MTSNYKIAVTSFTIKICTMVFLFMLALNSVSYCQIDGDGEYEGDEPMTLEVVGHMLLAGACIAGVGFLVSLLSFTETLGKLIMGIGGFIGIGSAVVFLIQRLIALLALVLDVGIKLFLFGIAVLAIISIINSIYRWLTGK